MIAYLTGEVLSSTGGSVILMVGGIGYRVNTTSDIIQRSPLGARLNLFVHHHIREDSSDLYGFSTEDELELFELLISVSGVGPKTALSAINVSSSSNIRSSIARGDVGALKVLSGIGPKTAQRIIVELKDKIGVHVSSMPSGASAGFGDAEVIEALVGLGYSSVIARDAVTSLNLSPDASVQDKIKKALQALSRSK